MAKTLKCRTCKQPLRKITTGEKRSSYMCMSSKTMCKDSLEVNFYDEEE